MFLKSKSVSEMHFPGSRDPENQISKSPSLGTHHRGTSRNSELANSKETAVDKKCLDKNLLHVIDINKNYLKHT